MLQYDGFNKIIRLDGFIELVTKVQVGCVFTHMIGEFLCIRIRLIMN